MPASSLCWHSSVFLILSASLLCRLSSVSESCILSSMDVKKWPKAEQWMKVVMISWLRDNWDAKVMQPHESTTSPTSPLSSDADAKSTSYGSLGIDIEFYIGNVTFIDEMTRHKISWRGQRVESQSSMINSNSSSTWWDFLKYTLEYKISPCFNLINFVKKNFPERENNLIK